MNSTVCSSHFNSTVCFTSHDVPWYYSPKRTLIQGVPDPLISLAAPVAAYWISSFFFHFLDSTNWKWLERYRIHESAEIKARNLVTRSEVIYAVIFQHVVQTLAGYFWLSEEAAEVHHMAKMREWASVSGIVGQDPKVLHDLAYFIYWWAVPGVQLLCAMFVIDTWQYFLHRLMHVNKWLYKHFHSWHHRLYVPYAYGALYNHPLEGFILDSFGALMAEAVTGMTPRQAAFLFTLSTFKTVDDHCGYRLPFDPLQWMSGNTADYHDIHHQIIGLKSNFSQPFFIHWDVLLGTRMTRQEIESRRNKSKRQ